MELPRFIKNKQVNKPYTDSELVNPASCGDLGCFLTCWMVMFYFILKIFQGCKEHCVW